MADIDVVPKRGTKLWIWIVVALAVIVILWFMLSRNRPSSTGRMEDAGHQRSAVASVTVRRPLLT